MWSKLRSSWWSLRRNTFTRLDLIAAVLPVSQWNSDGNCERHKEKKSWQAVNSLLQTRYLGTVRLTNWKITEEYCCFVKHFYSMSKCLHRCLGEPHFLIFFRDLIKAHFSSVSTFLFHSQSLVWEKETPCPCPQWSVLMTSPLCIYVCVYYSRAPSLCVHKCCRSVRVAAEERMRPWKGMQGWLALLTCKWTGRAAVWWDRGNKGTIGQ